MYLKLCFIFLLLIFTREINAQTLKNGVDNYAHFSETSITRTSPEGWLKSFLKIQAEGLTGNIYAAGYPYNSVGWKGQVQLPEGTPTFKNWWAYEQTAYWIDGALRCGYLLDNQSLIDSAEGYIHHILENARPTGELGTNHWGENKWPHAVLFRAFMAAYSATGNKAILAGLQKHFKATADNYSEGRNIMNIETMCWLYGLTQDDELLKIAQNAYREFNLLDSGDVSLYGLSSEEIPHEHGVTYLESVKIPIILHIYTGNQVYLDAALKGFEKLEKYHLLIDQVPGSSERLNGKRSNQVHETCDISDFIWSAGYFLMATGEAKWADKMEKACFNAGMGAITKDFKQHQYYSGPNQFLANKNSSPWNAKAGWYQQSRPRMAYRPYHDTECCTGNINRFLPTYVNRMWLNDKKGGITVALYGPSSFKYDTGEANQAFTIHQITDYPFSGEINFEVTSKSKKGKVFSLSLRIPEWSTTTSISINGEKIQEKITPGTFFQITREFKHGDHLQLNLEMKTQLVFWEGNGVALERGPLLFSYPIPNIVNEDESQKMYMEGFSSLEIDPDGTWAYAPELENTEKIAVITEKMPENPWLLETSPVKLRIPVWKIRGWNLESEFTPDLPQEYDLLEKENITLVPMGATTLRVTIFPDVKKRFTLRQLKLLKN